MEPELIAVIACALMGAVGALIALSVLRAPVRDLMTRTIGLDSASKFYVRVLILGLLYIAVAAAAGASSDMVKDPAFMDYVWRIAQNLDTVLGWTAGFIGLYMVMITFIVASQRRP